jgi:predicted NBD/HSP70 family sugar kinase
MSELAQLIANGVEAFDNLRNDLSREARALLAIACLAVILALIWVVVLAGPAGSEVHAALKYVPAAALTTLAILVVGGAILQQALDNRKVLNRIDAQLASTPRTPDYLIGCHLGRRYVACGVIDTRHSLQVGVSRGQQQTLISNDDVQREFLGESAPNEATLYDEAIRQLLEASSLATKQHPNAYFDVIGVALPGTVDPIAGVLSRSVSALPSKSHVAQRLARGMFDRASEHVAAAFRVSSPQELERRIVLDNDVRCATRALHHRATYADQNFACLSIGSGVGAGFVLNERLYYGSNRDAGEIGHVELDPRFLGHVQLEPTAIAQAKCSCGEFGRHFETMVNYFGLERLAAQISSSSDEDPFTSLSDAFRKDGITGNRYREQGLPQALTYALGNDVLQSPHARATIDDNRSSFEDFAQTVARSYAALVGGGIIGINATLDLDRVYLCGTLLERFQGLEPFYHTIDVVLRSDPIHHGVRLEYELSRPLILRGAALIAIDAETSKLQRSPYLA